MTSALLSFSFRAVAIAATAAALAGVPGEPSAQPLSPSSEPTVSLRESDGSIFGNYLAASYARTERDAASASRYYRRALKLDPKNPELLDLAFYAALADGDIDEAIMLGEQISQLQRGLAVPSSHLLPNAFGLASSRYVAGLCLSDAGKLMSTAPNEI